MFPQNYGQKPEIFLPPQDVLTVVLRNWVLRQTVSLPVLTTACVYKTNYMVSIKDFSKDYQKPHELLKILQPYLDLKGLK